MKSIDTAGMEVKFTECTLCHNNFKVPKILHCGHLLCRDCLVTRVQSDQQAACPLCLCAIVDPLKQGGQSAEEVADDLPTDLATKALVEAETLLSEQHLCCACDDVAAAAMCLQCGDMFCSSCSIRHQKQAVSRHHEVIELCSLTTEMLASFQPPTCSDHKDKVSELHCLAHSSSVCLLCATTTHRECEEMIILQSHVEALTKELAQLNEKLTTAISQADWSIECLNNHINELQNESKETLDDTKNVFDRLKAAIDTRLQQLGDMTVKHVLDIKDTATDVKRSIFVQRGKIITHKALTEVYKDFTEHMHFKDMVAMVRGRIHEIVKEENLPENLQPSTRMLLTIDPKAVGDIELSLSILGLIAVSLFKDRKSPTTTFYCTIDPVLEYGSPSDIIQQATSSGVPEYGPSDIQLAALFDVSENGLSSEITGQATLCDFPDNPSGDNVLANDAPELHDFEVIYDDVSNTRMKFDPMQASPTSSETVNISSKMDQHSPNISCIVTSPSFEELYMTDVNNLAIKIYSFKSNRLVSVFRMSVTPFGLTLIGKNLLAATTSGRAIKIINIEDRSRPRTVKTIGTDKQYLGLAFVKEDSNGAMLAATCADDNSRPARLEITTLKGDALRTVDSWTQLVAGVKDAGYPYVDAKREMLYVPDYIDGCVFCVRLSTGEVHKYTHRQLLLPRQVCGDEAGNLYVVSYGGQCVLFKSVDDQWRVLLTERDSGESGRLCPVGFCVTDSALVVTWDSKVKIHHMS